MTNIIPFPKSVMRTHVRNVLAGWANLTALESVELSRLLAKLVEQMDKNDRGEPCQKK